MVNRVLAEIVSLLRERLQIRGPLDADTELLDLHLDSLLQLTLVVELETHFRVRLLPGEEHEVRTLGDLAALVHRHLGAEARP